MTSVAIAYTSGYGHTAALAQSVADGVLSVPGVTAHLIKVDDITDADWETLDGATAIIFGSPTYMGTASAAFGTFKDASSGAWLQQKWKNKLAAGFTNAGSLAGDKQSTLYQMMVLASQHSMVWVSLGLMPGKPNNADDGNLNRLGYHQGAAAQSDDGSPEETPPPADHATAAHLGQRVARMATTWHPPADA